MAAKEERVNWAGRVNGIRKDFVDFPEMTMRAAAMQLEIVDILIDQLQNHGLYAAVLHREGTNAYRIALSKKYRNVNMDLIKVNFNRFNMSLMVIDQSGDLKFGTFRYRTIQNKSINCTLTSMLHFTTDEEEELINELKIVFHETEQIYEASDKRYREFSKDDVVDFNEIKFVDLCTKYTGNVILKGKLSRLIYNGSRIADMSAREFYETIDLDKLKELPGIGPKSISIIRQIYKFYGLTD